MMRLFFLAITLCLFGGSPMQAQTSTQAQVCIEPFKNGERILFLGDSITRAGGWHSIISLFYETRFPNQRMTWLNAGISGDTATGALTRLKWDVLDRKPDRVILMFGVNDVNIFQYDGENTPEKEEHRRQSLARYEKSMRQLVAELTAAHVKVILCTPPPYDENGVFKSKAQPGANAAVSRCAEITRAIAAENKLPLIEFNAPLNALLGDFQKTNPAFHLSEDRIHPDAVGCVVMAYQFLKALGVDGVVSETATDQLHFTLPAKALPLPFEGKSREGLHLVPFMEELNREIVRVTGLPEGRYQLSIDNAPAGTWDNNELEKGVNLAGVRTTPEYLQALEVKKSHDKRHSAASIGQRIIAFTKALTLAPLGIDEEDTAAVKAALEKLINDSSVKANEAGKTGKSKPGLGFGSYAQGMAKKYLELKPTEAKMAADIEAADNAIYQINRPRTHQVTVKPVGPAPADQRKAAFDSRHTPGEVAALAADFLSMVVLDDAELRADRLDNRPLLLEVAKLYHGQNQDKAAALNAYRDYLLDKLRNPARFGLPALADPLAELSKPNPKAADKQKETMMARADALMQGKVDPNLPPMPPGTVWLPLSKAAPNGEKNPWRPGIFRPLALAYLVTGDKRYCDQYFAYMDDWAMNEFSDDAVKGTDISDADSHAAANIREFYSILGGIARMTPQQNGNVPGDTLARILRKLIRVYSPLSIVYYDNNPQNWTPEGTATVMAAAVGMDEFKAAGYLFSRARLRHENYGTIQFFPDGSETESALWYNAHYFSGAKAALDLSQAIRGAANRLPWEEAVAGTDWEQQQHRKIVERARYFLQMLTPQDEYPIGNRSDSRKLPDWMSAPLVKYAIDSGAKDLEKLLQTLRAGAKANAKANTDENVLAFTMTGFPYAGSFVMRSGWTANSDYAHFYASPYPAGGHGLRGLKNNNSFYLSIAGQDLLVGGGFGSYSYERSPLRVDGKEQFFDAGIGNPGINKNHKGFGVAYIDPNPAPWRSHSGPAFDFVEGEYSGPFGDFVDDHHDNKDYRPDFLAEKAARTIVGVSHRRQVFFLKESGVWIVVDRLKSASPHEYTLDWRLPLKTIAPGAPSKYKKGTFTEENVKADAALQTISTDATGMANLTLHYFGPKLAFSQLREDGEALKKDYTNHYNLYDFLRLSGAWKSGGDDLVISLVEPRSANHPPLAKVERLSDGVTARGFKATTASGRTIAFLAATKESAPLSWNGTTVRGEALLVAGDHGIVLGGQEMNQAGQTAGAPTADFAFTLPAFQKRIPIFRPIDPVHISPERNVIAGEEPVSLSCSTPGVELRYTQDGSEPTPKSALYTGPFKIEATTTIKARAFRPGLVQVPETLDGTMASATRVAAFALETPLAALPGHENAKPGLAAEYAEGDWKDLAFFPERVAPKKARARNVRFLFDGCEPQIDKAFSWTYRGFLKVPADGVYTFHAPEEMITSPQEPGYALRLFIGEGTPAKGNPADSVGRWNEWYPATSRQAYGTWSIALKKGLHPFKVIYADYRADAVERLNHPGLRLNTLWDGKTPVILLSGPGMEPQPIPHDFFYR